MFLLLGDISLQFWGDFFLHDFCREEQTVLFGMRKIVRNKNAALWLVKSLVDVNIAEWRVCGQTVDVRYLYIYFFYYTLDWLCNVKLPVPPRALSNYSL